MQSEREAPKNDKYCSGGYYSSLACWVENGMFVPQRPASWSGGGCGCFRRDVHFSFVDVSLCLVSDEGEGLRIRQQFVLVPVGIMLVSVRLRRRGFLVLDV